METIIKDDPVLSKAHDQYKHFTQNSKLLEVYEAHMKGQSQYKTDLLIARDEGKIEGKIETAIKMLESDMAVALISFCTGLSLEEIEKLKEQ